MQNANRGSSLERITALLGPIAVIVKAIVALILALHGK